MEFRNIPFISIFSNWFCSTFQLSSWGLFRRWFCHVPWGSAFWKILYTDFLESKIISDWLAKTYEDFWRDTPDFEIKHLFQITFLRLVYCFHGSRSVSVLPNLKNFVHMIFYDLLELKITSDWLAISAEDFWRDSIYLHQTSRLNPFCIKHSFDSYNVVMVRFRYFQSEKSSVIF